MGDRVIVTSQDYQSFRSTVPQKKTIVDEDGEKAWIYYDAGPRSVRCPIICLPPASGSADVYFKQILSLSAVGYRIISVDYPIYWSLQGWCEGFRRFLDYLQVDKVHIFGASLGGYLAQVFAEFTCNSPRIHSLLLCNAFIDTSVFKQELSCQTFWMLPAIVLKKMVMGSFDKGLVDRDIADSIDFMVEKLDSIGQSELASRLTLNCATSYVEPQKVTNQNIPVTLLDVFDECALSQRVRDEMYKCYPDAKRAHMKSGGNFPYLSRSDEVNVYIQIHLKEFLGTRYSAMGEEAKESEIEHSL